MAKAKKKTPAAKKRTTKPAKKKVSFVPEGFRTLSVGLNVVGARAVIDFCKKVLGAKVRHQLVAPDGQLVHALLAVGDSTITLSEAVRDPIRTAALVTYVPNVDKTFDKAVKLGASVTMPPTTMPWGDRIARVADAQGNLWHLATHVEDVPLKVIKKRVAAFAAQQAQASSQPQAQAQPQLSLQS